MSDYFSLGHKNGNSEVDLGRNGEEQYGRPVNSPGEDSGSIHSNDSYLLYTGTAPSGILSPGSASNYSGISAAGFTPPKNTKDHILPKQDPKSPYYVNVPVPKALPLEGAEGIEGEGAEGQFVREYPTDILVDRFYKWRKILKGLIAYLREVAYAQEQFGRINYQLKSSVKFPFLTDLEEGTNNLIDPLTTKGPMKKQQPVTLAQKKQQELATQLPSSKADMSESTLNLAEAGFQAVKRAETDDTSAPSGFMKFGSGSVQDTQVILKKYHLSLANQQFKISKEITTTIVPKMEDLRKDLQLKIKEIKELHGDFKTNISEHVAITGQLLNKYIASVKFVTNNCSSDGTEHIKLHKKSNQLKPKHDPYLLKLQLDLQLKRQLLEENYLQEAYINLQTSGMELEKIVYSKIQHALHKYCLLIDSEARLMIKNLCRELQQGMLSKPPALEWDHFVSHHPACLLDWKSNDPIPQARKLSEIVYPQMKSTLAKCIRAGYLNKKSKYLKNYNKGYFVLTSNYLHEFKSSNFFKVTNSTEESKDHQTVSTSAQNTAKSSLLPVMSISLNDCVLMEASDTKFVLVGKPTFNDVDLKKLGSSAKNNLANLTSAASSPSLYHSAHDTPKKLTKSTFGKLLKGGKPKAPKPSREEKEEVKQYYAAIQQESNKTVSWVFKPASANPTEEDIKQFKKWAHDLKNLTSFNNTEDRARFIEERVLKTQARSKVQAPKLGGSSSNVSTLLGSSHSDESSFRKERPGRPRYIQLQDPSGTSMEQFRSRVNTPAVDDNGNLITVAERRNIPQSLYISSPLASPGLSPDSGSSSSVSSIHHQLQQQQQQQPQFEGHSPGTPGISITSNGITNTAMVTSGVPVGNPPRHQRKTSSTNSLPGVNSAAISAVNSPKSVHSDGSVGGYFAIPVNDSNEGSRGSTPLYIDDKSQQNNLSRTSSRGPGMGMRSASGGYSPQSLNLMSQQASSVPKLRLNDQDVHHSEMQPHQSDTSLVQGRVRRTVHGDLHSPKSDSTLATGSPSLYLRSNNSASSLTATTARTHPIRKHKKNVSFSSLNSLMFSKKGSNPGGNHITDQFMSGGIQEDDGDSENNSKSIKLNQSIYS